MIASRLTAVFSSDELGGSELFNIEFLRTARDRGVAIQSVVPGNGSLVRALEGLADRVEIVPIPRELTSMSRFARRVDVRAVPMRATALFQYIRRLRRTLIGFDGPMLALGLRAQLATALAGGTPSRRAWVVHEIVPAGPAASMWRLASLRADCILTYSEAAARQPALRGRGAQVHGIRLDLSAYAAVSRVQEFRRLGLVGDLVELKNHLGAVEVLERVRREVSEATLVLVGRDKSRWVPRTAEYVRTVRQAAQSSPGVQLTECAPAAMPSMMASIDVLLHLSTEQESFGRVVVEAMAAGRPVVAFKHGAVAELVQDGVTGYLLPVGDLDAVSQAVLELAGNVELGRRIGEAAREWALARFAEDPAAHDTVGDALADFAVGAR